MPEELIRFDRFQDDRLYGPTGFFTRGGGPRGRRDFLTAPEMGGLFGRCLASHLFSRWQEAGCPEHFLVVDWGAGSGALLVSIDRAVSLAAGGSSSWAGLSRALELVGAERSGIARSAIAGRIDAGQFDHPIELVSGLDDLIAGAADAAGLLVANELLDNVAVRVICRFSGGFEELWVSPRSGQGLWRELGEASRASLSGEVPGAAEMPLGRPFPWHEAAGQMWSMARELLTGFDLLAIDYGLASTADLAERGGWLRIGAQHHKADLLPDTRLEPSSAVDLGVLKEPVDITCDVAFEQMRAGRLSSQRDFLTRIGIADVAAQAETVLAEPNRPRDLSWIQASSVLLEREALLEPTGFGAFVVAEWRSSQRGGSPAENGPRQ